MMSLRETYIPSKTVKTQQYLPWINHVLRRLMRKQLRLFHRRTKSKKDLKKYVDLKKTVQRKTRQARWNYISDIVNQGEDKARKGFWSYVKRFTSDNTGIAVLQKGGIKATSPRDKADLLNKQFCSVFTEEAADGLPQMSNNQYPGIGSLIITIKGVDKMLLNLNANKAAGPDELHGKLLKNTAKESAPLLQAIFQCSIESGEIPEAWKKATISPVYKKSDRSDPANYRPVSLTCISCKILEHIINRHILDHLDKHNILADAQHGFRKRRSCETQLLLTCHYLASVVNNSGQVDMLVLDFAKAFDTVVHRRLLSKVAGYGIRGNLHRWITSFLEGRTQKVVVAGASSDPSPVKSGVPQGSVLGPLLLLLFINDLAEHTSSTVRLFADDCVMYKSVKTIQDCEVLQNDLDQLHQWEKRWQLRFNARKCNIMRATHAKKKQLLYEYKLGGEALLPTNSTAYLGVELSSDLKWNTHVRKTASKANQTLGVLRRNLKNCPREIKNMAYKTILRPKMEYAAPIWDPYTKDNIQLLEAVQRRAARFVCNKYSRHESVTSMLQDLDWPLLEQRRAESRLTLFHRIVHKEVDINEHALMERNPRASRKGNSVQFRWPQTSKDCFKYSFIPHTISQWNSIPAGDDMPQFKSQIKSVDLCHGSTQY